MYLLKTQGTGQIPDYLQIRTDDFVLIGMIKIDTLLKKRDFDYIVFTDLLIKKIQQTGVGVLIKAE